jgi:tRNA pseudouridine55 synthase
MNPTNGLLLVDKPKGITSHDVVARVRRTLGIRAIGHAGTLDPIASGLLILLIGEATKVSDYLLNGDKGYEVTVRLGVKTDSMDVTGQVLEEKPVDLSEEQIRSAVLALQGKLELQVPVHSAVKVDGRKLYEYAHRGQAPAEVPMREMEFFGLEVVAIEPSRVTVRMRCSKGSFIRAWANRLGDDLGCGGTVEELRRIFSEPFNVSQAITLEDLAMKWEARSERHGRVLAPSWVALKDSLPHLPRVDVGGKDEVLLRNGQISKDVQPLLLSHIKLGEALKPVRVISRESDDMVALLTAEPGQFYKIRRVFHNV